MVNNSSWPDVILAACFVVLAVAMLFGTFYFGGAYVFSNIKERWAEYSIKKRITVISQVVITLGVITILAVLSSQKLH